MQFHVEAEMLDPKFDLKVEVTTPPDHDKYFDLHVCFQHLMAGDSGMAVLEIEMPTGYEPDLKAFPQTVTISRTERDGRKLILYFEEVRTLAFFIS